MQNSIEKCGTSLLLLSLFATTCTTKGANQACPCINATHILAASSNCVIKKDNASALDEPGILVRSSCYPINYGSDFCGTHDFSVDPLCSGVSPPAYCFNPFCYVDAAKCHAAKERYYRSSAIDAVQNLYYSYSTCNSSAEAWLHYETTRVFSQTNVTLRVSFPEIRYPTHWKMDKNGNIYEAEGPEGYVDSIPWIGKVVDYFNAVLEISNIPPVQYMHRSHGSTLSGYSSQYTQAVSDVGAGIVDVSVGTYWITSQRLSLAPFTVPIALDDFRLWIKQPRFEEGNFSDNAGKVLEPFSNSLWLAIIACIVTYAVLSAIVYPERFYTDNKVVTFREKAKQVASEFMESLNMATISFVGRSVESNVRVSTAQKFLDIGFAIFIFIAVTAYTANLAAFLTLSVTTKYVSSIEEAISKNMRICAFEPMRLDLQALYGTNNWVWVRTPEEIYEAYDSGRCSVVVSGWIDHLAQPRRQQEFCNRELVRVGSPIVEKPIGLPARKEIVGGLSYWLSHAQAEGVTLTSFLSSGDTPCSTEITLNNIDADELAQLTPINMILPITLFIICCGLALATKVKVIIAKKFQENSQPEADDDTPTNCQGQSQHAKAMFEHLAPVYPKSDGSQSVEQVRETIVNLCEHQQQLAGYIKNLVEEERTLLRKECFQNNQGSTISSGKSEYQA